MSYITNKDAHRCSQESASAIKEKESLQAANVKLARAICDVCIVGSRTASSVAHSRIYQFLQPAQTSVAASLVFWLSLRRFFHRCTHGQRHTLRPVHAQRLAPVVIDNPRDETHIGEFSMTLRHWRAIWIECVSMTEQDRATGQAEELVWLGVPVD